MSTECYPIATLPHVTRLYRDYLSLGENADSPARAWYGAAPLAVSRLRPAPPSPHPAELADALERQSCEFRAAPAAFVNIAKLGNGARAIVSGQQVGLLGGPLLTLNKAATAVARAKQVTESTGVEHVPVFWLASEDHDLEEVNQVALLTKNEVETLRLGLKNPEDTPVGEIPLGPEVDAVLERASDLLGHAPVCEILRETYGAPGATFASAFARLMTALFSDQGLIVMDPSNRDFHTLGAATLRSAIEHAADFEAALIARSAELESAGYHAQVLVKPGASLLFLISESETHAGRKTRQPLRRLPDGTWKTGSGQSTKSFTTRDLLAILEAEPERISPNALLRPVFQDTILPTTAYIGGPAEVAYFAQSAVIYDRALCRITPILPRFSATLIEAKIADAMSQYEVSLPDTFVPADELAQRLGARAMPLEAKRRLAAAGDALNDAITAAQEYLSTLDSSLGQSAEVSASKMRYQMSRLRRLAANFELNKEANLGKHAQALTLNLFPEGHPQERVLAGAWFLGAYESAHPEAPAGTGLVGRLVEEAATQCPGHIVIRI